jgi:outer membrane lipoprotein SlyB
MENHNTPNRIHPLVAAASVSVILVSLVGVAAMTGMLPNSHGSAAPVAAAPLAAPVSPVVATTAAVPTTAVPTTAVPLPAAAVAPGTTPTVSLPVVADNTKAATTNYVEEKPKKKAVSTAAKRPASTSYAPRVARNDRAHSPAPQYSTAEYNMPQYNAPIAQAPAICDNCGTVESVHAIQQQAQPSGVGVVAGAVLGGVLGNQVGGGRGKTLATVAGAVGGGYAGNEIEKRTRSATTYEVRVRMENGRVRTFPYNNQPSWNVGDRIKVVDGYLTRVG